jgi:hypothetical protein
MITQCHPHNTKNQCSAFCCARNELLASIICKVSLYGSQVLLLIFGKKCLLDRTRSDPTFTYLMVMAAIVKIPTLVHLVLPPKKINIHVSVRLKNENKKSEAASFE